MLDSSASLNVTAGAAIFKIEDTNIRTLAVDMKQDDRQASFDLNSSFAHTFTGTWEKLNRVFCLAQRVNEEMEHLLTDKLKLPDSLKVKMPEFNNFVVQMRTIVVSRGFISKKVYEKRMAKHTT
jgi:hypothetical protein